MSDELLEFGEPGESEGLTPDEQALYRRLEADGAAWRAGSHGVERLGALLRQRAQTLSASHEATDHTRQVRTYALDIRSQARAPSEGLASMSHGRLRRFGAVAAALVVVGGLAALLLSTAPGRFRSSPAAPASTSTSVTQLGRWVDLSQLDYSPAFNANDVPAMAPSDPRVVYETLAQDGKGWGNQPAQLRRTDDEGATWHLLPLPVPADHIAGAGVAVSPLTAQTVFLTLFEYTAADCLADHAQPITTPGDAAVYCWLQFTSTDGGVHWTTTRLPLANGTASGVLTSSVTDGHAGPITSGALSAQGTRL
jgi:hypothetical protein